MRAQIHAIEQARASWLKAAPATQKAPHAMVRLLSQVHGIGPETADMLTHEVFSRNLRDHRATARYAGLTGAPDESGGAVARRDWPAPALPAYGAA